MGEIELLLGNALSGVGPIILLPPDPSIIKQEPIPLGSLARENSIVMQDQGGGSLDGGDSANRTGVLAFCGSVFDQYLLGKFENDGIMRRHPTDVSASHDYTNPNNCTRDQLIGFLAGCWRSGRTDIATRLLEKHEARGYLCQNTEKDMPGSASTFPDPLFPHEQMFLRICAGQEGAHLDLVGQAFLQYTIEAVKIQDDNIEINQLLLESVICCRLDHFVEFVPDYAERLNKYWGGWRQQQTIADELSAVVKKELVRYKGFLGLSFPPLPVETVKVVKSAIEGVIDAATHINWWTPENVLTFIPKIQLDLFSARIKDAEAQLKYHLKIFPIISNAIRGFEGLSMFSGSSINSFLGASDADEKFEEIMGVLHVIDAKIDEIISFLKNDLLSVVESGVIAAISEFKYSECNKRIAVDLLPSLQSLREDPSEDTAENVREISAKIIIDITTALDVNGAYSPMAASAIFLVLSAASELLRFSVPKYDHHVLSWCAEIKKTLNATVLDETSKKSFISIRNALPSLGDIISAEKSIDPSVKSLNVYWGATYYVKMENFSLIGYAVGYWAKLNSWSDETGTWSFDAGGSGYAFFDPNNGPPDKDWIRSATNLQDYQEVAWYPLQMNFTGMWEEKSKEVLRIANEVTKKGRLRKTRIAIDSQFSLISMVFRQADKLEKSLTN